MHSPQDSDVPTLRRQRGLLVRRLAARFGHFSALVLIAADWNFVGSKSERWNKGSGNFTGDRDQAEQQHWAQQMGRRGFYEREPGNSLKV